MSLTNDETATEMDDAEQLRAQAAQHRTDAAAARAEAETTVQAARAQSQRLIAEAEQHASQLATQAREAETLAAPLEERAQYVAAGVTLRRQVADVEATIVDLKTEADDLAEQTTALDRRLADLGAEREDTAAALAGAREAGDVDQVTALRPRVNAIDEVTSVLQGQRQTAQDRLTAIGDPDGVGDLPQAARAWQSKQAELRAVENWLDPTRPEAQLDEFLAVLSANAERITEQAQPNTDTVVVRTARR